MNRILPILVSLLLVLSFTFSSPVGFVFAQTPTTPPANGPQPTPDIPYTRDAEVNFVGKAAARSIQFLNWTLQNYYWQCFEFNDAQTVCDNSQSPLIGFWATIRNIVYAFFALLVLITAFVLMTTRGKSLTIQRFLPRFVAVILLVTFSYAMLQFIYITADIIQGFFLTKAEDGKIISAEDLLFVGWNYETFEGLRKVHAYFDESAFVNLLLARVTAVTYYAITGVLLIRKIILWFFIVLSPVFPVLLLYYPVRNTAKIWIGEFFRWLMYGPLFSIFLAGLVSLWRTGIPLLFNFNDVTSGRIVYPTATNILLGGPGQVVTISNNLNVPDTFAQYVVALIMLWVVLLLPFVLLQIFLDYLHNFSFSDSPAFQKILSTSYSLLNKPNQPLLPPGSPGPSGSTGIAKPLPFAKFGVAQQIPDIRDTGIAREIPMAIPMTRSMQAQASSELLRAASLSVPTMRDIVKYETDLLSQKSDTTLSKSVDSLKQIANPSTITNQSDRDRMVQIKDRLVRETQSGNSIAGAVLSAVNTVNNVTNITNINKANKSLKNTLSQIANPASVTSTKQRDHITKLHESLVKESQSGNNVATSVLSSKEMTTTQMQDMREKLIQESLNNNIAATNVLASSMGTVETATLQQVIKEIANPESVTGIDKEKITQIHDTLVKESEAGNEAARAVLAAKDISTEAQTEEVKEKLLEASTKGDKTAASVLSTALAKSPTNQQAQVDAALPQSNRVQAVSFEDYEAVKKMWQENYKNLDVPEGAQGRKEWIANDVKSIDQIVSLLTSEDEQKVQEGMQQVSNILPFLLLGGFSKDEIVAYLKAKKEAGKSVLEVIEKEEQDESTMVTVETHHETASATQAMSQELPTPSSGSDDSYDDASPITQVINRPVTINVSNELLQLTSLPVPTMKDVVKFELSLLAKDATNKQEVVKVRETLTNIGNPSRLTSQEEKQKVEQIREKLIQNSQQGDQFATSILQAADHVTHKAIPETVLFTLREYFAAIANPDATKPDVKKVILEDVMLLHQKVAEENKNGNVVTQEVLDVTMDTPIPEIQRVWEHLIIERTKGSDLAGDILGHFPQEAREYTESMYAQAVLPQTNRIQTVTLDDYEAVRSMWEENFRSAELPAGETDRAQWLQKEKQTMESVLSFLTSNDQQKIQEGMQSVSYMVPFLLLGGFTLDECIAYLKAKLQAAVSVEKSLANAGDQVETVSHVSESAQAVQAMAAEIPAADGSSST